jgi:uncharacterized protein YjbI with pentapeptide repeats
MPERIGRKLKPAPSQGELNKLLAAHEHFVYGHGGQRLQLRNTDLHALNFANRNLSEADFSGSSLVGSTLFGSNLSEAVLNCTDLQECDLHSAKLTRADLRGASFRGAKMSYAQLDEADIRVSIMSRDIASGVDFTNCSMKCASFRHARLDNADFRGAFLQGAQFEGANVRRASFCGAVLMGVDVAALDLPKSALADCVFDPPPASPDRVAEIAAMLEAHRLWIDSEGRAGAAAVLDGLDIRPFRELFADAKLSAISLRNAIAVGVDFSRSQLQGSRFDGADLRGADFGGVDLRGAVFRGAKLLHANFDRAKLQRIDLIGGGCSMPDLTDAEISPLQFVNAILDDSIIGLDTAAVS